MTLNTLFKTQKNKAFHGLQTQGAGGWVGAPGSKLMRRPPSPSRQAGLDDPPAPPVVVGGGISWEGVLWEEPFLPLLWTTLSAPGFWVSFSTEGAGLNDLLRRFLLLSEPLGS